MKLRRPTGGTIAFVVLSAVTFAAGGVLLWLAMDVTVGVTVR